MLTSKNKYNVLIVSILNCKSLFEGGIQVTKLCLQCHMILQKSFLYSYLVLKKTFLAKKSVLKTVPNIL